MFSKKNLSPAIAAPTSGFRAPEALMRVLSNPYAGAGAVRELSELILFAQNKLHTAYAAYLGDGERPSLEIQ